MLGFPLAKFVFLTLTFFPGYADSVMQATLRRYRAVLRLNLKFSSSKDKGNKCTLAFNPKLACNDVCIQKDHLWEQTALFISS